ncbi:PIH1 domain-containing protein 2-like [Antedon mediterranea]|uniref:PIH1 domain-containing protein 2-like n=1 Tax=Antedon mediterranea TaxID=105859 RepID=UPI003AF45FAD
MASSSSNEGSDELMKQAQHIWSMLDELADSDPEAYKKFIEKNVAESKDQEAPAAPCMCIQTTILSEKQCELFINICSWSRVPGPKTDHDPIPVIAGKMKELIEGTKKHKVIPIAFNTEVLKECFEAADTTRMLLNLSLDYVTDQFKLKLDRNYTKLKDSNFKGDPLTLATSFINKRFKDTESRPADTQHKGDSLIGNLGSIFKGEGVQFNNSRQAHEITLNSSVIKEPINGGKLIEEISITRAAPEYSLEVVSDTKGRHVDIRISLPNVNSVRQCELDISSDDVSLIVEDLYKLQLALPEAVSEDDTSAKFIKKSSTLNIKIPTKLQEIKQ